MKTPKNEPYRRSPHRAALHAWVVAATTVASIGMPAAATAKTHAREAEEFHAQQDTLSPTKAVQQAAKSWWDALRKADLRSARSLMSLPADERAERDAIDEAAALSDYLADSRVPVEPVAERVSGHWALSAWRLGEDTLIEPVTLYHPALDGLADGLSFDTGDWQVVPQGFEHDAAIAPLVNDDHAELMDWYKTLK